MAAKLILTGGGETNKVKTKELQFSSRGRVRKKKIFFKIKEVAIREYQIIICNRLGSISFEESGKHL